MIPRYSTPEMNDVWSDVSKFARFLEVEILATEGHAEIGVVPAADALVCRRRAPHVDEAFVQAINAHFGQQFDVVDYAEHAIGRGSNAQAVAYVETTGAEGNIRWGLGQDPNITTASLRAVLSAFERQYG